MIYTALSFLSGELNTFIKLKDPLNIAGGGGQLVTLTSLVDQENKLLNTVDGICLTLVNTEEETVGKSQLPYFKSPEDLLQVQHPDIKMNLYLLFSAYADPTNGGGLALSGYEKALKLLDEVILFFQFRQVFRSNDYLALEDAGIEKLMLDPISLSFEQQNHLWATLGAKYMPSVMYKCRMLTFREEQVSKEATVITDFQTIQNQS